MTPPRPPDDVESSTGTDAGVELDAGPSMQCLQGGSFAPRTPTVYVLVDRSGTMFDALPEDGTSLWSLLRSSLLPVLEELHLELRFGFAAASDESFMACPDLVRVPPALGNAAAITEVYAPLERGLSADSGMWRALDAIATELWNDPASTEPHILLATDGAESYCNDGNALCPPDSVIAALQRLRAGLDRQGAAHPPIPTLVVGMESIVAALRPLQAYANAGAGQPVLPVLGAASDPLALFDQCSGDPSWNEDLVATGKPLVRGQTVADYSTSSGNATVLPPAAEALRAALSALRSCTFELTDVDPTSPRLDIATDDWVADTSVSVNAAPIPNDPVNGWHVTSATTLTLEGVACDAWRASAEPQLQIDFPCDAFVSP